MKGVIFLYYGRLVKARKTKVYSGKSMITHKVLKRVSYQVYFYDDNEKILGYLAQNKPYTYIKSSNLKSDITKFLIENNYSDKGIMWEN